MHHLFLELIKILSLKLSCLNDISPSFTSSNDATKCEAKEDFISSLSLMFLGIKSSKFSQPSDVLSNFFNLFIASSTEYNLVSAIIIDLLLSFVTIFP